MKIMFYILSALLLLLIFVFFLVLKPRLPIGTGYVAKNLCSCVFVAERDAETSISDDLDFSLLPYAKSMVNYEEKSVMSSLWGMATNKAIYREGLGCTLVADLLESDIRQQSLPSVRAVAAPADSLYWPQGEKMADTLPETIDPVALKKAIDLAFMPVAGGGARGVVVVYKGQLIAEKYAPGFDKNTRQLGWSMTKSITNALIGIQVQAGKLQLNEPVPFSEWQNDDRRNITINNLLQMSSGLAWEEVYSKVSSATRMLYERGDMADFVINHPLKAEPGSLWEYSSGTSNLLCGLIRRQFNDQQAYLDFPRQALFNKIGMRSAVLETDAAGTFTGSSYAWATPRDWARFGLLYLQDGLWNGERLLPEGWVKYTRTTAPASEGNYGAHFWLNSSGEVPNAPLNMYSCQGFQDQRVFILPTEELIIVRLGQNDDKAYDFNAWMKELLAVFPKE
ncbi:MAG: serine hydrolase [Saprospiraceae bacterium]|nr:MAG: serine hydrolase [Saprospiraceae bacterium]